MSGPAAAAGFVVNGQAFGKNSVMPMATPPTICGTTTVFSFLRSSMKRS